ncbi:hypothetical protein [Sinomonas sp. P47F7]|uniref:hypothetical protein n=1 Tax=Sinomonas sp. P47F7 TaxID=3410987 RepID=UPI003BF5AB67
MSVTVLAGLVCMMLILVLGVCTGVVIRSRAQRADRLSAAPLSGSGWAAVAVAAAALIAFAVTGTIGVAAVFSH